MVEFDPPIDPNDLGIARPMRAPLNNKQYSVPNYDLNKTQISSSNRATQQSESLFRDSGATTQMNINVTKIGKTR